MSLKEQKCVFITRIQSMYVIGEYFKSTKDVFSLTTLAGYSFIFLIIGVKCFKLEYFFFLFSFAVYGDIPVSNLHLEVKI